jgi:hypothetical protein
MLEHQENAQAPEPPTPTEAELQHMETGSGVEFGLLPGQRLELSLSPDGIVSLRISASEAPPAPPPTEAAAAAQPVAEPAPDDTTDTTLEKQERVTISGRVGTLPAFRTTPRGTRVAQFKIAEHPDTEATTWHTILAFSQRAEQLERKPLQKGQAVEVIGFPHYREVTTNGVKKTVEEIYATAIKRR